MVDNIGYTHYSYLCGPNGVRQATGLYKLAVTGIKTRRELLHKLMANGELLSKCPWGCTVKDMNELQDYIDWLRDQPPKDEK